MFLYNSTRNMRLEMSLERAFGRSKPLHVHGNGLAKNVRQKPPCMKNPTFSGQSVKERAPGCS